MMADDYFSNVKIRDPYNFVRADEFFSEIDKDKNVNQPCSIKCLADDNDTENPVCKYGRVFRFNDDSFLLIEFIRPKVWRIRFHETNKSPTDFSPYNTRTIVQDTLEKLISVLDASEQIHWRVELIEDQQFYVLQSVQTILNEEFYQEEERITLQLWIQRKPFKIMAIRPVKPYPPTLQLPTTQNASLTATSLKIKEKEGLKKAIVWETDEKGFKYSGTAAVLSIRSSSTAKYIGFGEQGGRHFFKKNTYMNYFNYDNMRYQNVYRDGPRDEREPLYHSEPYWVEVNGLPGFQSQVTTFIDNYSHVCVDLSKGKPGSIRVATRFNDFQCILVAADNMAEGIQSYTSIIGHPRLKPRYVLGNHQGCYGYMERSDLEDVVNQYRANCIPLDGLHIDVDIQREYRTFTIDTQKFWEPVQMFRHLRNRGIKCGTNITPYVNSTPDPHYRTYNEGIEKGYFILDDRDVDPSAPESWQVRYLQFAKGAESNPYTSNPSIDRPDYKEKDIYNFHEAYNSKTKPFHGGVYYGGGRGSPGVYPNLNNSTVRDWWGKQYKYLFDCGLEFVWQDMTSPCIAEQYGDMKSFPFRLLLDSDGHSGDPRGEGKKKAIEIWSLYSYNLHKATYQGLNHLISRKGKRNFIIGRGSFAGMHRYAGLWTGDNASTWDFLDISVAQVLALGLSGVTISGADVGGFERNESETNFADPELIIRWYCAYSLLPWFRNHYIGIKRNGKLFQEPYAYQKYYEENKSQLSQEEANTYLSVLPVCRYYIRLRYSLLQLLYDAMFENLMNGLPIARSMLITDHLDHSLYGQNKKYVRGQYLVRNDLLVSPQLFSKRNNRTVYLPYPDSWYSMNLRPDDPLGDGLMGKIHGGSRVEYWCPIRPEEENLPFTTPMYIREGAIIPKIEVRDCVPDPTYIGRKEDPNPITFHIYPGKDNTYHMYLDDGVSRESAPTTLYLSSISHKKGDLREAKKLADAHGDEQAKDKFCHVKIRQESYRYTDNGKVDKMTRRVTIMSSWNHYPGRLEDHIGTQYTIVLWHDPQLLTSIMNMSTKPGTYDRYTEFSNDKRPKATIFKVPISKAHTKEGISLELSYDLVVR